MDCPQSSTGWQFKEYLDRGAFGSVSLWYNPVKNVNVAIKKWDGKLNELDPDQKAKTVERWQKEIALLNTLRLSDHIVGSCAEICSDLIAEQSKNAPLPVIAMEYCDGGNLRQRLERMENLNGLSEYEVRQVLFALKMALELLHNQYHITHRDIKPENVLIKMDPQGNPMYKLGDMGYARALDRETIEASLVGTQRYFAPEIISKGEYKNTVDYWSMAVVGFEVICGVYPILPFHNVHLKTLLEAVLSKPPKSIAVTKSIEGKPLYHYGLFKENRLSSRFCCDIEFWLQIGLQIDGRQRGREVLSASSHTMKPQFFEVLDCALQAKHLTMFSVNSCKFLSYTVAESMTIDQLYEMIETDIGIDRQYFQFVLPTAHQLNQLAPNVRPIELWDEKLLMNDMPMVYLIDFKTDFSFRQQEPFIPEMLKNFFNSQPDMCISMQQCFRNGLYLCQNELRRAYACVNGLKEYYMLVEDVLIKTLKHAELFHSYTEMVEGQRMMHYMMVDEWHRRGLVDRSQMPASRSDEDEKVKRNLFAEWHHYKDLLENTSKIVLHSPLDRTLEDIRHCGERFQKDFTAIRNGYNSANLINELIPSFLKEYCRLFENIHTWMHNTNAETCSPFDVHRRFGDLKNSNIVERSHLWWEEVQHRMRSKAADSAEILSRTLRQPYGLSTSHTEGVVDQMEALNLDNMPSLSNLNFVMADSNAFDPSTRALLTNANSMIKGLETFLTL